MAVTAKFYVSEVTKQGYNDAVMGTRVVKLQATSRKDEDSRKFFEATPYGVIELKLSADKGQRAGQWFEDRLGKSILLTFEDYAEEPPFEA